MRYLSFISFNDINTKEYPQEYYQQSVIVPLRGSIYRNGQLIAWSSYRLGLFIKVPRDIELLNETLRQAQKAYDFDLSEARGKCVDRAGKEICIKEQLSVEEINAPNHIIDNNEFLAKKIYEQRHHSNDLFNAIGRTEINEKGFMIGLSQLEKKYDERLVAKQAWVYRVLVDKDKEWVAGTYHEEQQAIKGDDIFLDTNFIQKLENE